MFEKLFDGMADEEKEDITRLLLGTSSGLVSRLVSDDPDDSEDDDSFATKWESDVDDTGAAGYNGDSDDDSDDDNDGTNDNTYDSKAEIRDADDINAEIGSNDDGDGDDGGIFENGYVSSSSSDGFESPGDASTEENNGCLLYTSDAADE